MTVVSQPMQFETIETFVQTMQDLTFSEEQKMFAKTQGIQTGHGILFLNNEKFYAPSQLPDGLTLDPGVYWDQVYAYYFSATDKDGAQYTIRILEPGGKGEPDSFASNASAETWEFTTEEVQYQAEVVPGDAGTELTVYGKRGEMYFKIHASGLQRAVTEEFICAFVVTQINA